MLVSVDVGNGYTKAVSEDGQMTIFPSIISYIGNKTIDFGWDDNFILGIEIMGRRELVAVGEAARKESRAVLMSFTPDRYVDEIGQILLFSGAYLVGAQGDITLGIGVPLSFYSSLKEDIKSKLTGISANIQIEGKPKRTIRFSEIYVFPQGFGAIFSMSGKLPETGLLGIIDIGYFTTDYTLFECRRDGINPLRTYSGSIQIGISTAVKIVADEFTQKTGRPLTMSEAQNIWEEERITFKGQLLDFRNAKRDALNKVGKIIKDAVLSIWSDKVDFAGKIFLIGGGAMELSEFLLEMIPQAEVPPLPQFANALGYMAFLKRQKNNVRQAQMGSNEGSRTLHLNA
ncbi:hypothetical protein AN618_21610 [Fervidicola ferrireducens]|uniref:Uncharacterized protein n=1 Tax=Fervidicola ferrireducens TaxID=520764 RepID=A0A140L2U4_9FIRM|nr:ParM/StbA family protein [Fervidicola ferrireducens]KXG74869.1 hypothetical protein AN618_21610 [Fervidicola ferrireducens]